MTSAAERWARALEEWAIPPRILEDAPESPFGFPVEVFARAADEAPRDTPSRHAALEALTPGDTVLDVGCGAGAAALALVPPAGRLIGVDEGTQMLDAFAQRAERAGVAHAEIEGRWPDIADQVDPAEVVVCHHVLYNVADLASFAAALDTHARNRVVVELTASHPLSWMNPLWARLHGLERPEQPTAEDAVVVLGELGLRPSVERWTRPSRPSESHADHQVAVVRKRLCLGPDRDADVAAALEAHPFPEDREIVTLWW